MFDLEKSIAEWRQQMFAAGIKTPMPLEELEIHLREDVQRQLGLGLSTQQSFEMAVAQIGQAAILKREFNKTERPDMINHNRMYSVTLVVLTVCNATTTVLLLYWLAAVGGQLGKLSPQLLPWMTALSCVYTLAMIVTLLARQLWPQSGRRMTRFLNWALLPAFPWGTAIGSYGLWKVDKERA